ncbi:SIR2 family protein [Chloroflexota bacterium]
MGSKAAANMAKILVTQSLLGRDIDFAIRFEYLLQLIKDYFATDLTFIKTLMDFPGEYNNYQLTLDALMADPGFPVFTTNFDNKLEKTRKAVYRDSEFENVDTSSRLTGLFKLHGSIEDTSSLGATFDSVTEQAHKTKRKVLETGLRQGDLWVIGYGGGDDTDVIPTLTGTYAWDREVYWFQNFDINAVETHRDDENGFIRFPFTEQDTILEALRGKPSFRVLDKMIKNGVRDRDKVFLIAGIPEIAFEHFLMSRNLPVPENNNETPPKKPGQRWITQVIEKWYAEMPLRDIPSEDKDIVSVMVGATLTYIVGKAKLPQQFGKALESITKNRSEWYPVALPKLAMVSYDDGKNQKAERQAREAQSLLEENSYQSRNVPQRLVEEARIDSYVWRSEAMRMLKKPKAGIEIASEGLKLASNLEKLPEYRRLIRLKGDLHAAIGENYVVLGDLSKAEEEYRKSVQYMEQAAEWNWYWYGQLGIADILRTAGWFQTAKRYYQYVRDGSYATGWQTWLAAQVKISEYDLLRCQFHDLDDNHYFSDDLYRDLCWLADGRSNKYDESIVYVAKTIKWDVDWIRGKATKPQLTRAYRKLVNLAEGDSDSLASLRLGHAEYYKHSAKHNKHDDELTKARKEARKVIRHARRAGYKLLELHGRLILEDINRLENKRVDWQPLLEGYRELGCIVGEVYGTALGLLSGAQLTAIETAKVFEFASANKMDWLLRIFEDAHLGNKQGVDMWLLFPGVLTTF